jgi:chromosome condensin MukBEF MukE localization factor
MDDTQLVEELRSRFNAGEKLKYVFFWGHQPGKNGIAASCFWS